MKFFFKLILLLIMAIGIIQATKAQSFWGIDGNKESTRLSVEWTKPFFDENGLDENDKISFFSTSGFIKGNYQVADRIYLYGDIPFSHWEFEDGDGVDVQEPHTTIGNLYIGGIYKIPFKANSIESYIEVGGRLPTMPMPDFPDKRGSFTGFIAEPERREAFIYKSTSLMNFYDFIYSYNKNFQLNLGLGISYWINPENLFYDQRIDLSQKINATVNSDIFSISIGLTGKYHTEGDDAFFQNYNTTQLRGSIIRKFNSWDTQIYYRSPLDNTFLVNSVGISIIKFFDK